LLLSLLLLLLLTRGWSIDDYADETKVVNVAVVGELSGAQTGSARFSSEQRAPTLRWLDGSVASNSGPPFRFSTVDTPIPVAAVAVVAAAVADAVVAAGIVVVVVAAAVAVESD